MDIKGSIYHLKSMHVWKDEYLMTETEYVWFLVNFRETRYVCKFKPLATNNLLVLSVVILALFVRIVVLSVIFSISITLCGSKFLFLTILKLDICPIACKIRAVVRIVWKWEIFFR